MKDRLLTLALAVAAFAAFYALLGPKDPPQERPTRPVTTEAGPNGYLGLLRWLEAERIKTLSLRDRYTKLAELAPGDVAEGNLLLSTAPHLYPIRYSEWGPLRDWISKGNTLLIVAGLSDTPDWSMGEGVDSEFMEHMYQMTSLRFEQVQSEAKPEADNKVDPKADPKIDPKVDPGAAPKDDKQPPKRDLQSTVAALTKLATPQRFPMQPAGSHPLLDGVTSVTALSEFPSAKWRATADNFVVLELARDPELDVPVLWLMRYGAGQIIISAYGSVFTNKLLGEEDNARLLSNIVRWSLEPGGRVIIDDAHQGLVAFYDPDAFFGDSRLHATLWWLIGLWLVFVLGSQHLRPAVSSWNPIDITSFVRATGGFMARVLTPSTAGRQMFANFFNDTRRRIGLPLNGAPVWDWLQAQGGIASQDIERLQDFHSKVLHGLRVDLSQLHNLLVQVRATLK